MKQSTRRVLLCVAVTLSSTLLIVVANVEAAQQQPSPSTAAAEASTAAEVEHTAGAAAAAPAQLANAEVALGTTTTAAGPASEIAAEIPTDAENATNTSADSAPVANSAVASNDSEQALFTQTTPVSSFYDPYLQTAAGESLPQTVSDKLPAPAAPAAATAAEAAPAGAVAVEVAEAAGAAATATAAGATIELLAAADELRLTAQPLPDGPDQPGQLTAAAAAVEPEPRGGWKRCSSHAGNSKQRATIERRLQKLMASLGARTANATGKIAPAAAAGGDSVAAEAAVQQQQQQQRLVKVHFHIVTYAGQGVVSMRQVRTQMTLLNDAYNPHGFTFQLESASYYRSRLQNFFTANIGSAAEYVLKRRLRKGGPHTLNIYAWQLPNDLLGWATFPWDYTGYATGAAADGVVVRTGSLPGGSVANYNEGKTVVHEVGHWLGLYHTFQDGCSRTGDMVADTPAQAEPSKGCPVGKDTCRAAGLDLVSNFMDYSYDSCMTAFTNGQGRRMQVAWDTYRAKKQRTSP